VPPSGMIYANVHLDYGFKRTSGWQRADLDSDGVADDASGNQLGVPAILHGADPNPIPNPWISGQPYILQSFANDDPLCLPGPICQDTIYSVNIFKRSVGVAGTITNASDMPVPGVTVKLWNDAHNQVLSTATTDSDGAYYLNYKATGGWNYYWVQALTTPSVPEEHPRLKSNGFVVVNFQTP